MRYNAEDLAEEVRDVRRGLEFSPEELDAAEERLAQLRRVTRKYGGDEEAALEYAEGAQKELNDLEFSDERRRELERARVALLENANAAAAALTKARTDAAARMKKRIEQELAHLAMPAVRFAVALTPGEAFTVRGAEDACFLMSANAGEEPGKVARIASGGELSRIMLALKNVLAETDPVDVMVFDEVDAGVSGIAAQRVGEKLSSLADARQVLVVTHLPQIAAMADRHFAISKAEDGGRTRTSIRALDRESRVLEISRLTGGDNITETTKKSAAEQLDAAEAYKSAAKK
jgi:DNA repair protein RecN (Recombination protein N)